LRDASFSASKYEDFPEERGAPRRRGPAPAAQPAYTPSRAQQKTSSVLARVFAPRRMGFVLLLGIGGLAFVGVPMNALFLQDGRHPAPLFSARPLALEKPEIAEAPAAPARVNQMDAARTDGQTAKTEAGAADLASPATKPGKSDAAALKAMLSRTDAGAPAKAEKKRDPIAAMLGGGESPAKVKTPPASHAQTQAAPATPAPAPKSQTPAQKPQNQAAAKSENVVSAQRALQRLGYVVRPDGVVSPATRQAIEKFERDNGLPAKGELTPKIARLIAARAAAPRQ
jgi:hypothetical protein